GLALAGLDGAEAGLLDLVALLQRRSEDAVARVEQGVDRALRVRLRQLRLARQVLDQLGLVHGLTPLDMKLVTRCADPPPRGTANCGPAGPVPSGPEPGARTCAAPPTTANSSRNGAASIRSIGSDARKVSGTVERDRDRVKRFVAPEHGIWRSLPTTDADHGPNREPRSPGPSHPT